ncbi:MAG TPA: phospholipase D-like domain-containing protein [Reyranellaceae bacterium]|nr:phospholipase D-like domain-containing protein [Reyranellaceae bacterium]
MAGPTSWRIEQAARASLIVDADAYFQLCRSAMLKARRRIMLVGWDFDARIELTRQRLPGEPRTLGEFVLWLVRQRPELEVFLLRWDVGALRTLLRGTTAYTLAKWMLHRRIHTRLDHASALGASHHHKIVVIDDAVAFCGGIDMTTNRWDTPQHLDDDPRRMWGGSIYAPWHDTIMAVEGAAAAALGELARERWQAAGGGTLPPVKAEGDCWPDGLGVQFKDVRVSIARTNPVGPIYEIENAYLDMVNRAQRFLYAECQYFASRRIAEAMARRLAADDAPEIVLMNPESSHGWLEPIAMDTTRARLFEAVRRHDKHGRLRIYHPYTSSGAPIYLHAKMTFVDDQVFHVGSSNMNNRSLRLDTECDLLIDAAVPGNEHAAPTIAQLRNSLLAEHLGVEPAEVACRLAETGSLIATVEALRDSRRRSVGPYEVPRPSDVEKWLADHEVLDPEHPDETFEVFSRRTLFRGGLGARRRGMAPTGWFRR